MKEKDSEFRDWKARKVLWQQITRRAQEQEDAEAAAASTASKWRRRYGNVTLDDAHGEGGLTGRGNEEEEKNGDGIDD